MDVYHAINTRRTVRDFQDKPVEQEIIQRILDAGLRAPSNDHMRTWEFIIVDDMAKRVELIDKVQKTFTEEEVAAWLDSWGAADPVQRAMYMDGVPKQHRMLLTAGCLILPCFKQPYPLLRPDSLSALNGFASVWCCIENILVAAASEGVFGVTRIPFAGETEHIKACLNIPADYEVPCYMALGYPKAEKSPVRQLGVRVEERMRFNGW